MNLNTVIPKKIHYIWFGKTKKSELILRCINSWAKYMPDYEIIEWNESNYDIHKNQFIEEAYKAKKWAFASDFARFDIIANYGGIYFDTDVELLKPIPVEVLNHNAFTGFESAGKVAPGLVLAAVPKFPLIIEILEEYKAMKFYKNEEHKTVNIVVTDLLNRHKKLEVDKFQIIDDLALYPSNIFCGYDMDIREYDIRPETVSIHHYGGSWKIKGIKSKIQDYVKKVFGIKNYRRILKIKRKFFGVYDK